MNLSDYLTATRRLLHDANGNFWSDAELTDYINLARQRVVSDSGCLRQLQTITLTQGVESYAFPTPAGNYSQTLDIMGISVIWGNERVYLGYLAFTELTTQFRWYQAYTQVPRVFSVYGQKFYVAPIPDQTYSAEVDTVVLPTPLVDNSTVETIIYPFTEPVPYYAARLAKMKEQSFEQSNMFKELYVQQLDLAAAASYTRRVGFATTA